MAESFTRVVSIDIAVIQYASSHAPELQLASLLGPNRVASRSIGSALKLRIHNSDPVGPTKQAMSLKLVAIPHESQLPSNFDGRAAARLIQSINPA